MKKYFLLILTAISLLTISCNPDGPGIFYKISIEPPLSDSALSEKSVYKVVDLGGVTYVLAGGAVYKEDGSDWDKISAPSGENQAVSLASNGTTLYSVYADDDNSSMYQFDGSSWIQATGTSSIADSNDLMLIESDNTSTLIFVCVEVDLKDFEIHSYNSAALSNLTGAPVITMPVVSATFDGTADYYIVSSNTIDSVIYTTDGTTLVDITSVPAIDTAIGSILYHDTIGTKIYAAGKDGILYSSDESAGAGSLNWTAVNVEPLTNLKLGAMDIVDISGTDYLLIGSDGGFYEMELPSGTPVPPTSATIGDTDYVSVDLFREIVFSIMEDGTSGFYIGTSNGLWYSDFNENILNLK